MESFKNKEKRCVVFDMSETASSKELAITVVSEIVKHTLSRSHCGGNTRGMKLQLAYSPLRTIRTCIARSYWSELHVFGKVDKVLYD